MRKSQSTVREASDHRGGSRRSGCCTSRRRPESRNPFPFPTPGAATFSPRPRLTGGWGGFRDEMGKKGIVLDVDFILTPQAVATGGVDTGAHFWGNAEYTLDVDTQKAGLWPGGFLKVVGMSGFGDNILADTGALVPPNTALLLPSIEPTSALMNATFMQFLSPKFGLVAGKIFTVDGAHGEFTGNFRTQFENTALTFPMATALVPISAYGGGVVGIPWDDLVLTASAIDPDGTPTNNDIADAFRNGVMVLGARCSRSTRSAWSATRVSISCGATRNGCRSSRIRRTSTACCSRRGSLVSAIPTPCSGVLSSGSSRTCSFPSAREPRERHVGRLLQFRAVSLAAGRRPEARGRAVLHVRRLGRRHEPDQVLVQHGCRRQRRDGGPAARQVRIGWARTEFSDNFLPFLRERLDLGLEREDAIEMYYNVAVTGWLEATLDLQIIEPALTKTVDSSSKRLEPVGTTVVPGVRLYVRL